MVYLDEDRFYVTRKKSSLQKQKNRAVHMTQRQQHLVPKIQYFFYLPNEIQRDTNILKIFQSKIEFWMSKIDCLLCKTYLSQEQFC